MTLDTVDVWTRRLELANANRLYFGGKDGKKGKDKSNFVAYEKEKMSNVISIEEYKKIKNNKIFSQYAFLRPFNLDNLRYHKVVKKSGITFNVNAYISPYDGRTLFFDVYNKDCELIKIFFVTEEEHYFVPNLDYHIWNKIDDDSENNPVDKSQSYLEYNEEGKIDERDLLPPWDKENEGRFSIVKREDYEEYFQRVEDMVDDINWKYKDAYDKTMRKKKNK